MRLFAPRVTQKIVLCLSETGVTFYLETLCGDFDLGGGVESTSHCRGVPHEFQSHLSLGGDASPEADWAVQRLE